MVASGGCTNDSLDRLPAFELISYKHEYKVDPYIHAAITLQTMGYERACREMMKAAKRNEDSQQIYILCRMLFQERGNSGFRRPSLGGAVFLGGTDYVDWPLDPIEVVDGVPFVITWGYGTTGAMPEPPEMYLNYCMTNCDWNTSKYRTKSNDELEKDLNALLMSPKWKRPLEPQEREIIARQIN
jgi:hypothetical protein